MNTTKYVTFDINFIEFVKKYYKLSKVKTYDWRSFEKLIINKNKVMITNNRGEVFYNGTIK